MFSLLRSKNDKNMSRIKEVLLLLPEELRDFLDECPIQYKLVSYIQPLDKYDTNVYNGMVRQRENHFDIEILESIENDYLFKEVLLHEVGHIIDIFLGNKFFIYDNEDNLKNSDFVSNSIEMNINYRMINRVLNILLDEEDYGYYLNNTHEMFAEVFALYYSGHYTNVFKGQDYVSIVQFFKKIERVSRELLNNL